MVSTNKDNDEPLIRNPDSAKSYTKESVKVNASNEEDDKVDDNFKAASMGDPETSNA